MPLAPLGRPPRLVLRFALYTGAVLLAAGLAILWTVNHEVAARAQRTVETQARLFAEQNLRRQLLTSDFTKPVRGSRRAVLDALVHRQDHELARASSTAAAQSPTPRGTS